MPVTSYRSPTATDISSGVTNPDNAHAEDDAYAVFTNINQFAQYSTWGDFSIPGGNSITGFELRVRGKHTGAGVNHALWAELSYNSGSTVSDPKDIDFNNTSEVEVVVGGDGDLWGLATPALTDFDGTTSNVDVTLTVVSFSVTSIDVDSIALRVYYDIIVNTFTKTFTADAIVKTINTKTFTADGYIFPATQRYSKGDLTALPTDNDTNLETLFENADFTAVATSNDTRTDQSATGQVSMFLFKDKGSDDTLAIRPTVELQSTIAPSEVPVILEIFNRTTELWEELDRNDTASADTDFTLEGDKSTNLSDYYDVNGWVSCRVYQNFIPS